MKLYALELHCIILVSSFKGQRFWCPKKHPSSNFFSDELACTFLTISLPFILKFGYLTTWSIWRKCENKTISLEEESGRREWINWPKSYVDSTLTWYYYYHHHYYNTYWLYRIADILLSRTGVCHPTEEMEVSHLYSLQRCSIVFQLMFLNVCCRVTWVA